MVVVVQVLSNMNVAELVDFVKVSPTNGELPDGHHLMMIMMIILMMMIIMMMIIIDHHHDGFPENSFQS